MRPIIITYNHAGYNGQNKPMTQVFANGSPVEKFQTPSSGISSSYQELELAAVARVAERLYPDGFRLPYLVDQGSGYVYADRQGNDYLLPNN